DWTRARVLRHGRGALDPSQLRAGLSLVVRHSRRREECAVPDANGIRSVGSQGHQVGGCPTRIGELMSTINLHKHLPRRTVLRGLGAAIALPFLDSMTPAFSAIARAATPKIRRLGVIYVPNGMNMSQWTPAGSGGGLELTRILKPLEAHRDRMLLL